MRVHRELAIVPEPANEHSQSALSLKMRLAGLGRGRATSSTDKAPKPASARQRMGARFGEAVAVFLGGGGLGGRVRVLALINLSFPVSPHPSLQDV